MQRINYRMLTYTLGLIALVEGAFLVVPFVMSLINADSARLGFGVTVLCLAAMGIPAVIFKPKERHLQAADGFVIVGLSWLLMSFIGAIPYVLSGFVPSYVDALFETVSGFTTTGSSIINGNVLEAMPKSLLLWRSLTQWMGGMGVLVFVIAILPNADPEIIHLFRAEVPGPSAGKLVSKLRNSARILYCIYIALTLIEMVLLCIKMPFFDSVISALSTASTGGFSCRAASIAAYDSVYVETVIMVFMYLFSLNFNLFFFLLLGRFRDILRDEEFWTFFGIVVVAMFAIATDLYFTNGGTYDSFGECLRNSSFYTISLVSTTGFCTVDYTVWPALSQTILFILMFLGGCAGSTAGGLKISRVIIMAKSGSDEIRRSMRPRTVSVIRYNGHTMDKSVTHGVQRYFLIYMIIFAISALLVAVSNPQISNMGISETISGVAACFNNIGPAMGALGPMSNFASLSVFSKCVLIADMLLGRLEILPLLILFVPKTWK